MTYTIKDHIVRWWDSLTPKYRNKLCTNYLGFQTYFKDKELLLKNYQKYEIYNAHFKVQIPTEVIDAMDKINFNPMHPITFTEASNILLDGGVIVFTAENNRQPEQPSFNFEITDFQDLCSEYRKLREDYFNIQLYTV